MVTRRQPVNNAPKKRLRRLYVGCLEGRWAPELTDRQSVLPVLELLESQDWIRYFHRPVDTKAQLLSDLKRATQLRYRRYEVLYLGFHGSPGALHIGNDKVTLEELACPIAGQYRGRTVHFASCSTGYRRRRDLVDKLEAFRQATRAKTVTTYTRDVDWTESAAFEVLLFSWLASYGANQSGWALKRVFREYPDLTKTLGFVTQPDYSR